MSTGRRRSKWDQPAPLPAGGGGVEEGQVVAEVAPPPVASQQETVNAGGGHGDESEGSKGGSQAEAARAAARLNAMLAAQGKLGSSEMPPMQSSPSSVASSIRPEPMDPSNKLKSASVDINDSPSRVELMKTSFLAEINKKSGAILAVRGQYMPALEKEQALQRGEKALHIHIQAPQQSNVDLAVKLIAEATAKARAGILNLGQQAPPFFPSGQHYVQDKVFIGLDQAPEEFHLNEKLQGPGNSYFEHIMSKTKARIHLRGRGSGYMEPTSGRESFEALYIYLQHSTPEGLKEARTLCDDLVKHVHKEYESFKQQRTAYRPPFPYTPFPGYGPLGYFGPPTNPGSFPIPPPPGYFPPPQPYSGPSYPDPNVAYSFAPGGYHGYNLPPTSSTESTHPPTLESTATVTDEDKAASEKKEEPPKRKFTEKPLPEVTAESKKLKESTPDGEQDGRQAKRENDDSVGRQKEAVDHAVVEGSHMMDAAKDEENDVASNKDNCAPSHEAMEASGFSASSLQPPSSLMPPPRNLPARIVEIGQKRPQVEESQVESQPEPKKVSPRAALVVYDSDSDSETDTP